MADPRGLIESSFATVSIECRACRGSTEIEDVEFVVSYPGARPHGHRFDLPEGWTINPPEDGALCGIGITCGECNGTAKPKRKRKRR